MIYLLVFSYICNFYYFCVFYSTSDYSFFLSILDTIALWLRYLSNLSFFKRAITLLCSSLLKTILFSTFNLSSLLVLVMLVCCLRYASSF